MKKILSLIAIALPFLFSSCVKDAVYEGPTTIDNVSINPEAPTSNDEVTVTATCSGLQEITSAVLTYNGTAVNMTVSGMTCTGIIPKLADKTAVTVVVTVKNSAGFETKSAEKSYKVGNPATDWSKVKINELYGAGADNEKAIELYNGTDFEVSLEGVTLHKDEELTWTGIKGEVIPAHGVFAIVGAKGTTERGFSSGLSAKKSVLIQLMDPNGKEVDRFQRGEKGEGWGSQGLSNNSGSWSRIPDGSGKFMITESHSIGSLNASSGKDDPTVVQ